MIAPFYVRGKLRYSPTRSYYQDLRQCGRVAVVPALPSVDDVLAKAAEVSRYREDREHEPVDAFCGGGMYSEMRRNAIDWLARQGWCARDVVQSPEPFDWVEVSDGPTRVRFVEFGPNSRSLWLLDLRDFDTFVCTPNAHYGWVLEPS